jgi:predicted alpha-1,2-mannosidase
VLSVLPLEGYSSFSYERDSNTLYVKVTNCSDRYAVDFAMYAVIRFGKDQVSSAWVGEADSCAPANEVSGENACMHLLLNGPELEARLAVSYIGFPQAELNLERELGGRSFDEIRAQGERIWENYLSRVEIEAQDEAQMKTFYSCMYRAFLYPHKCYELNAENEPVHYCPHDGGVRGGVRYTDNGFWDTYRTVYPFFSLVAKKEYKEMCEGFVNDYLECGWLPRWPSIGERGCMPSTLIDAVLCDAAVKGLLTGKTLEDALEGMLKHANVSSANDDYGRSGAESYVRLGYVPIEAHKESVNLTLDAAYGDWCIARIAGLLGKTELAAEYDRRAENYKNLFDPETGFMRARFADGSFRDWFDPTSWGEDYTEGSAWQNSFAVPHDIEGLAALYGGKAALERKIDELFAAPPTYQTGGYGCEIHEMTEMAAVDFGQCAISNQPSFHIPYIYAALGNTEKTAYWTEKICRELFSYKDDGFPGDEDNGSMALWYVFSSIGIYPFCPGKNGFVRTKKLVKSVKLLGKPFNPDAYAGNTVDYYDIIK